MRKNTFNFLIDLISLLVMVGMIATGLLIRYILPAGSGHSGQVVWSLDRHEWGDVHFWLAISILILLLAHVVLHWAWICTTIRRLSTGGQAEETRFSPAARNLYGVGVLASLVGLFAAFLWIASASITFVPIDDDHDHGHGRGRNRGPATSSPAQSIPEASHDQERPRGQGSASGPYGEICGFMSLSEIEAATDVPETFIRDKLGLPEEVSSKERLGPLKHKYNFEMSTIRRILEDYHKAGAEPRRKHRGAGRRQKKPSSRPSRN